MVTMALDPLWYRTASKEKRRIIVLDVRNDAIIRDELRAGCSLGWGHPFSLKHGRVSDPGRAGPILLPRSK